jgi:hypothetical protein
MLSANNLNEQIFLGAISGQALMHWMIWSYLHDQPALVCPSIPMIWAETAARENEQENG